MNRTLALNGIAALLLLTFSLLPSERADARPGVFSPNLTAEELIEEVNALRESKGLPPYRVDARLMKIAQAHAEYIAEKGVLTHFSADGKRPYQRALEAGYPVDGDLSTGGLFAENIHSGINLTPADVVQAWQGHSTHSATLLSSDYVDAGAGIATADGVTYYVLDAGAADPAGIVVLPATPTATRPAATGTGVAVIPNTPPPNGEALHVVKKDEALWSIALAYGTTIEELKFLNGLFGDEIFEGQTLIIQLASTPTVTPSVVVTATFGISTSTPTKPVTPTVTTTATPLPKPPTSLNSGGLAVGAIVLAALTFAGLISLLGRKKKGQPTD
ncbi:MAG: LysM peptidoglycan-binding domain-containing protein [Chloroflexi bacterium]|nr:LysM peptidoglycan-binding domain-containing protein [Chloroflexota bacterium]